MSSGSQTQPQSSSSGEKLLLDKAARVKAVTAHFTQDGDKFKCTIGSCNAAVACQVGRGAPGRERHLAKHHAEQFKALPAKFVRCVLAAKAKRNRDDETILWLCRRAHAFTELDDEFIRSQCSVTRKNFLERASPLAAHFLDDMLASSARKIVTLAVDGGTNAETATQNLCANIGGVSWFLEAARLENSTAECIKERLVLWAEKFKIAGAIVAGSIADNAANMQCALELANFPIRASCACHTVQLFVRTFCINEEIVHMIDKCRSIKEEECPTIPCVIDSRWNSTFMAIDVIVKNWAIFLAYNGLSREESEKLKEAHARLLPHYNDTLRCEGDGKNLFAALAAFVNFRPYDQDAGFMEKWERNVSKPWVMVAALLLPQLIPETIEPFIQARARSVLLDFAKTIIPDADEEDLLRDCDALLDGSMQRVWRQRRSATVEDFWNSLPTGFSDIALIIAAVPASSSNVERSFSQHARVHTVHRKSLGENSVNVVMQIAMGQNAALQAGGFSPTSRDAFQHSTLEWLLGKECLSKTLQEARELKPHDRVVVFLIANTSTVTRQKKKPYACKLLKKVGGEWDVVWDGDKASKQTFAPHLDEWTRER